MVDTHQCFQHNCLLSCKFKSLQESMYHFISTKNEISSKDQKNKKYKLFLLNMMYFFLNKYYNSCDKRREKVLRLIGKFNNKMSNNCNNSSLLRFKMDNKISRQILIFLIRTNKNYKNNKLLCYLLILKVQTMKFLIFKRTKTSLIKSKYQKIKS